MAARAASRNGLGAAAGSGGGVSHPHGGKKRRRGSRAGMDDGLTDMDRTVLGIVESYLPEGCPNLVLQERVADTAQLLASLNKLVKEKRRIELLSDGRGGHLYRAVDAALAAKLEGLSRDELHILQHIEKSHDMGIWIKDLKRLTGLQGQTLTKSLKRMMGRGLIKKVSSKTHKQRKLYMMFDVQPNRELTGGAMYTTDTMELDHEFIKWLRRFVIKILRDKRGGPCPRSYFLRKINQEKFNMVDLAPEEIQQILDTLEYDGRINRADAPSLGYDDEDEAKAEADPSYSLAKKISVPDAFTATPCGVCPVFDDCTPTGVISPATCVYLDKWLEF